MKNFIITSIFLVTTFSSFSQDILGKWNGSLKVQGVELPLIFTISKLENGYSSTMDSPSQGAKNIPTTKTSFENSKLIIEIANAKIEYVGELKNEIISGIFKQNGQEFPMELSRKQYEKKVINHPQEPKAPFSYYSEDVTFENNKEKVTLAGTLTLPKKEGNYPVVILISGSGAQNRDEQVLGQKPFLVVSDYLTKNGIAVLRYDDRGTAKSKGNFASSTSANFATDVESAIEYLKTRKEINKNKIGLVGHSEGGMIAPMVASKSKDVNFIVLLAAPGMRGDKLLLLQKEKIERAMATSEPEILKGQKIYGGAYDLILKSKKEDLKLKEYFKSNIGKETSERDIDIMVNQLSSDWVQYYLKYDPAIALEKTKCPVLAVNGEKDLQVPSKENLEVIKKSLLKGGNKKVTIIEFPKLNHLFQTTETGNPSEYETNEETFNEKALQQITSWILNQVK